MALLSRLAAVAVLAAAAGCAQSFNFNECTPHTEDPAHADDDCLALTPDGGGKLYCTSDHLCVLGVPEERLCPEQIGDDGAPNVMVVGVLYDRNYDLDVATANAVKLAVAEINTRQSGAAQPMIVAHFCDTASDPDQTLKAAKRVVEVYHGSAIIGPTTSGGVVAINQYTKDTGTLVVSPSATAVDITSLDDNGLVWRTAPSDALQAKLLATKVAAAAKAMMTTPRVDTLHVDTVYGTGLDLAFQMNYAAQVGPGFARSLKFDSSSQVQAAMNSLAADGPTQAVLIADVDDPALVAEISNQPALASVQFYMTDAAKNTGLFGSAMMPVDPTVLARIRGTAPSIPLASTTYMTFRQAYITQFTTDPSSDAFVANAYDAAYLVAIAAAATDGHVPTGRELASGMMRFRSTGTAVATGPAAYLQGVQQMKAGGVRMEGASGALEFDASGDVTPADPSNAFEYWCINTTGALPAFSTVDAMNNCQ